MDIGARCQQCRGWGNMGGGRTFAYPGQSTPKQFCDLCHGAGRNDGQPPATPQGCPDLARYGVSENYLASLEYVDANPPKYPPPFGALN